ncbi:hypothetical protein Tsubulata_010829 [Turnera subulata]|uniref:Solute carrier family 40 member n=1 Tax=Turnera subulata TaxID=218843 RepID=A0A9Q0JLF9_9ROSI|nr:hypothetical protein Tsubulata_010829 [Turnera subulata]
MKPLIYGLSIPSMVSLHLSSKMWEFSVGLHMISFRPESLILPPIYGAVESASTALFGSIIIGQRVERLTYVQVG